jgi:cytochrome oxidase assembly protein ShyY1
VRSWGFVLSRRWLLFAAVVVVLGYATWWLGQWQFDRLEDRKHFNAVVRANEHRDPAPVEQVLSPGGEVDADDEWRVVRATGTYDAEHTVVVRYRTRDGASGVDVVVPLVTVDGTALLVDRGWLETDPRGEDRGAIPDPPPGDVEVTGWVRADGSGDSTNVSNLSTRAIASDRIGAAIGRPAYGGFVELRSEDPEPTTPLQPVELPELDNGPHFFYGLQWWFFGLLAIFGFFYLLQDERRNGPRGERERGQRERSMPPSTGSITPVTNEAAGESRKAATRPNSSGSP